MSAYLARLPNHGSTTDEVTEALREAILDGVLPPSTWLREQDLARALQVSRTPVREALRRLADEQLVERVANRGSVVRPITLDEVLAVYLVRESLEGLAARTAALRQPAGLVAQLERTHARMETALQRGRTSVLPELNLAFHRAIRDSTSNAYLTRFLLQVEHAVRRFPGSTYDQPDRAGDTLAEHRAIIDAIADGDPDRSQDAAARHMRRARQARIDMLVQGLDHDDGEPGGRRNG